MKILQVITRRQYRGAEVFARDLSTYLNTQGNSTTLLGILPPKSQSFGKELGVCVRVEESSKGFLSKLRTIARVVRDLNIGIVQANASITLKHTVLSRRFFGWDAPIIYRNASIASAWVKSQPSELFNRWLLSRVDRIACVSDESSKDLIEFYSISQEKVLVVPNAIPIKKVRKKQNVRIGLKLLNIGSFTKEKNQIWLITMLKEIVRRNQSVHLSLVGSGPLKEDIMSKISNENLEDYVEIFDVGDDVTQHYCDADIFVLSSTIEGLPAVLLEAGSFGIPIVATKVGSIPDLIPKGFERFVVAPWESEIFTDRVMELVQNSRLRKQYGDVLRLKIQKEHSIEKVGDRFMKLYKELLNVKN